MGLARAQEVVAGFLARIVRCVGQTVHIRMVGGGFGVSAAGGLPPSGWGSSGQFKVVEKALGVLRASLPYVPLPCASNTFGVRKTACALVRLRAPSALLDRLLRKCRRRGR